MTARQAAHCHRLRNSLSFNTFEELTDAFLERIVGALRSFRPKLVYGYASSIGAVVSVTAGGLTQSRLVRSGTSYISQCDMRQHFGLGAAAQADVLEVRWPDGTRTRLENVKADQVLEVRQP